MADKDIILSKWLSGEISDDEVRATLGDVDLTNLRLLLGHQEALVITSSNIEDQWDQFNRTKEAIPQKESSRPWMKWLLLAAAFLASALVAFYLLAEDKKEVTTPAQEFELYAFEDGSTARLWPGARLSYHEESYLADRLIELEGQAFFDVKKGASFIVKTPSGKIKVLGTSFDIWSIDKRNMQVLCHTGQVEVSNRTGEAVILSKGDQVQIRDGVLSAKTTFDVNIMSIDNHLKYYDNAMITWVIDDLKSLYGMQVDIDSKLAEQRFTGVISTKDLDRALTYLCETMQWRCAQDKTVIHIIDQE